MPSLRDRYRLILLVRGLFTRRRRPDLESLAQEPDPERFLWRVLPHAARSFAASIVVLPRHKALATAVAYLYCRMLDTYEDLHPRAQRVDRLLSFGDRFGRQPMPRPNPIPAALAVDDRDRLHLLLVERCSQVDAVFDALPAGTRSAIAELVRSMAAGMAWSLETLARQGGAFLDESQVSRYCHHVMGNPIVFALRLAEEREPSADHRRDALAAGEMIQLANITRDIERDLARGVAYHSDLRPYLGADPLPASCGEIVRRVREELLLRALSKVTAYRSMAREIVSRGSPGVRTGAVLMLLFTDLHFRGCAIRTGHAAWRGPRGRLGSLLAALPALLSRHWAERAMARTERRFLEAAERLSREAHSASRKARSGEVAVL